MGPISWGRLAELAEAESEGRIAIMPHTPGTVFKQRFDGEDCCVEFTGRIMYETVSNNESEWFHAEDFTWETGL